MSEYALKDHIDRKAVRRLGEQIQSVHRRFDVAGFTREATQGLKNLEFTQRTRHIAVVLREFLPDKVPQALGIITKSLPDPLSFSDGMFKDNFWLWPLSNFVHEFGGEHWQATIDCCYRLTQCFTAEFAIRPQLQREPEKTMATLLEWTSDPSEHVRRLCSEGTRPRLPWASRLSLPREGVLEILEALNRDQARYVQKSVANHLNDLGKDDSNWLLQTMNRWNRNDHPQTGWIIRHALRNHIKDGDATALSIVGYGSVKIKAATLEVSAKKIKVGQSVSGTVSFKSAARTEQTLLIDWIMHFARPNGQSYKKVFKGKEVRLHGGAEFHGSKVFPMKTLSTRKLYPGTHRMEVQVNGKVIATASFELLGK
jgi:3-methyladenine DNA glycosylase AlkC